MSAPDDIFKQGVKAYQSGDYQSAAQLFQTVIDEEPQSPEAWLNLGNAHFKLQTFAKAKTCFLKVLDLDPLEEKAYLNLGNVFYAMGLYRQAVYHWEVYLTMRPRHSDAWLNLALAYEAQDKMHDAVAAYVKYLRYVDKKSAKDLHLERHIQEAPELADPHVAHAEKMMGQGNLKAAQAAFQQVTSIAPMPPKFCKHYASVLYQLQAYTEAAHWYEEALRFQAKDVGALINLGVIYDKLSDPLQSLWAFSQALGLDPAAGKGKVKQRYDAIFSQVGPGLWDTVRARCQACMAEQDYGQAELLLERYMSVERRITEGVQAEVEILRSQLKTRKDPKRHLADQAYAAAEVCYEQGQYEKALAWYDRFMALMPTDEKAYDVRKRIRQINQVLSAVNQAPLEAESA